MALRLKAKRTYANGTKETSMKVGGAASIACSPEVPFQQGCFFEFWIFPVWRNHNSEDAYVWGPLTFNGKRGMQKMCELGTEHMIRCLGC